MDKLNLTGSQRAAADRIKFFWEVKMSKTSALGGISTRPIPLLVGPSGAGKTAFLRDFAAKEGIAIFSVSVTSWIVRGAKAELAYTCQALSEFVNNNSCGIIFFDELNKLRASHLDSSWMMDVMNEVMAVLDMDERLLNMGFTPEQLEKINSRFLLVGAGTWQEVWVGCKPRATMGFARKSDGGEPVDHEAFIAAVRNQEVILDEMLFRFNEHLLLIAPPAVEEVAARISAIREEAMVDPLGAHELAALSTVAVASNRAMRWLEAYTLEILSVMPKENWRKKTEASTEGMLRMGDNASNTLRYTRMHASTYAILQRLAYDISLAATNLSNRIRSEGLHRDSTTERCLFLDNLASAAYRFTQPNQNHPQRTEQFDVVRRNVGAIAIEFSDFSQRIIIERVDAATRESLHRLQQLAFQFLMEAGLLIQIVYRPEELISHQIIDRVDPRVEWFAK